MKKTFKREEVVDGIAGFLFILETETPSNEIARMSLARLAHLFGVRDHVDERLQEMRTDLEESRRETLRLKGLIPWLTPKS